MNKLIPNESRKNGGKSVIQNWWHLIAEWFVCCVCVRETQTNYVQIWNYNEKPTKCVLYLTIWTIQSTGWSGAFLCSVAEFTLGTATWQLRCAATVWNICNGSWATISPVWAARRHQIHFDWIQKTRRRWTECKCYWASFVASFCVETRISFLVLFQNIFTPLSFCIFYCLLSIFDLWTNNEKNKQKFSLLFT